MLTLPQIGKNELSLITCPAYIVAGEYDIMWLTDTVSLLTSSFAGTLSLFTSSRNQTGA